MIYAGNVLAQTDININNTNLIRFGGSVTVPENQLVENALAMVTGSAIKLQIPSMAIQEWQTILAR